MYFSKDELISSIKTEDRRIRNYLEVFGFVVIRNLIPNDEIGSLKAEYQKQMEIRAGELNIFKMFFHRLFSKVKLYGFRSIINKIKRAPGIIFVGNFLCSSKLFTNFFFSKEQTQIYQYFAGKNWIYYGSDGQKYVKSGYSWHRDWFAKPPIYKMFFKMSDFPQLDGYFRLIPGTQFPSDIHTKNLSKSMMWPLPPQDFPDGLSEKYFLPRVKNTRNYFDKFNKKLINVPHVCVKLKKGDALIFNTSLPHTLSQGFPNIDVDMMSFLFAPNPIENGGSLQNKNELDYLVDLFLNERNHCKVELYGEALLNHPFFKNKNHFIVGFKDKNGKYIKGAISFNQKMIQRKIPFNKYRLSGRKYRSQLKQLKIIKDSSTWYGFYDDEHLGIVTNYI